MSTGGKSVRNIPVFLEKNEFTLPLAVAYGGTGLSQPGSNGQYLTTGSTGLLEWKTLPAYPTPSSFGIESGTWEGQMYGWVGSLANPTGGPWNFTGSYAKAGDVVSISFIVSGDYSSAALGSKPYISGMPTFGKTAVNFNGALNSYYSTFDGASLPYTIAMGEGASGQDMTFFTGATQLTFQLSGGHFEFYGSTTYNII